MFYFHSYFLRETIQFDDQSYVSKNGWFSNHRVEMVGSNPWDGGLLIVNPIYTLYTPWGGDKLGPSIPRVDPFPVVTAFQALHLEGGSDMTWQHFPPNGIHGLLGTGVKQGGTFHLHFRVHFISVFVCVCEFELETETPFQKT